MLLAVTLLALAVTREGFLAILAGFFLFRLFTRDWPAEGDRKTLVQFTGLILVLAILLTVPVPKITGR